jgi:O-antigen ligase
MASLSFSYAGSRLIASVLNTSSGAEYEQNAEGTQRAREMTWTGIWNWVTNDSSRTLFGSGFGNDFLSQSGVLSFLEGTTYDNVRSPHDWLVGVLARTGFVGAALAVLMLLALCVIVWRNRDRIGSSELLTTAALVAFAIVPISLMGVVLEAPFGAIPFWWSLGILSALGKAPSVTSKEDLAGVQIARSSERNKAGLVRSQANGLPKRVTTVQR